MANASASRNEIVGIADEGLIVQIDGHESIAHWSAIVAADAVMALVDRTSGRRMPIFVFGIMDGSDERLFIVGETEPMWARLASSLPNHLPGVPSFEIWSGELAASGRASLYSRAGSLQ